MVAPESASLAVTLPAGATYRFGDHVNELWSAPITLSAAVTLSPLYQPAGVFPFDDPDVGQGKELDVLEIAGTQSVSVSDLTLIPLAPTARIIPGLVPAVTLPVLPGSVHTLTFTNFVGTDIAPSVPALVFVNAAADLSYRTWEGTSMELDIDGVALICSFGDTYTDQTYTLSCSVPQ
jgi:hypothetical protein